MFRIRAGIAFPLTALTLLFLLQGASAFFGSLFALSYNAIFEGRGAAWLQMLLPLAALLAPAIPLARRVGREQLLAGAAIVTALARLALCIPTFEARWIASALVVAGGSVFLSAAVGCLNRRAVTAGAATAILLEQVLRMAGGTWDVTMRPGLPFIAQALLSALAAGLAGYWLITPPPAAGDDGSLERRTGGMRLRGAVVLAGVLFLETAVLAQPAVLARFTGLPYTSLAVATVTLSALAVVMHARLWLPARSQRIITLTCAGLAAGAAAFAPHLGGYIAALLLLLGHAAALILLAPALSAGGGRRKGWTTSVALALFVLFVVAYGLTFFAAFTLPYMHGQGPVLHLAVGALLALGLVLLPRTAAVAPLPGRMPALVALTGVSAAIALGLAAPGGTRTSASSSAITVATFNVHLGYDAYWRFDPERIARTIEESGADVVALQEVPVGLPLAYGIDLSHWLARRLGMHAYHAPTKGGLLGDALLVRDGALSFTSHPLAAAGGDAKQLMTARIAAGHGFVVVAGTHLGLSVAAQRAQIAHVVALLEDVPRVVLAGDLNAEADSEVAAVLQDAGFHDAFALARATAAPTWPASAPAHRIDWLWVRGYDVNAARTSAGGGSDHRLVAATLLPQPRRESTAP